MNFDKDVERLALEKIAGLQDMISGVTGSQGSLSAPAYGLGGAALGGLAGSRLGSLGMLGGAALGGLGGYGAANAINTQGAQQQGIDQALAETQLGQMAGGSPMDQQQNQLLQGIVDYLSNGQAPMEDTMAASGAQSMQPPQKAASVKANASVDIDDSVKKSVEKVAAKIAQEKLAKLLNK